MNARQFKRLQDQWRGKLAASGFSDIEAPSGIIQRRRVNPATIGNAAADEEYYAKAQAFLASHRFAGRLERLIWEHHCRRLGRRKVAKAVGTYPKKIDQVVARLKAEMNGAARRPRGRQREEHSLRSEGLRYELRLTRHTRLALDHLQAVLKTEAADHVRRAIEDLARRITVRTE